MFCRSSSSADVFFALGRSRRTANHAVVFLRLQIKLLMNKGRRRLGSGPASPPPLVVGTSGSSPHPRPCTRRAPRVKGVKLPSAGASTLSKLSRETRQARAHLVDPPHCRLAHMWSRLNKIRFPPEFPDFSNRRGRKKQPPGWRTWPILLK